MATTTLNTRIQLKYDTYENWTANNPVLLAGEVAVTTVQSAQAPVSQVPAILFKVGDGTNNFNTLNWASAIAADVYPWAKASVKPTYQASEIEGLEDYISGQIEDTDTQYQIIASGTNGIQLQSRPKTGGAWSDVGSPITITYTLETGTTNGTVSFNGTEVAVKGLGSAAYTESSAYDAAGTAAGVQTAVIGTSGDQSSAITIYGTRKYAAEQATAAQTAATTAANSYTDGQITQAKTDLIGTGDATSTTIKGAVAESKTYADTQIAAKGVPSTEGVPTDYLLSPSGWVAPPSGGGGAARLVIDDTTTEAAAYLYYNQDSDGSPFDYQHIIVFVEMPTPPDPATTRRGFWIRYDDGHVGPDGAQYNYTGAANSNDIAYGRVLNAEIQILELESKCYISFSSQTGNACQLYVFNRGAYISPSKIGEVKFLMSGGLPLIPAGTRVCIWAVG